FCFFFFSSRRRHTRFSRDWSSDVCSSDLSRRGFGFPPSQANFLLVQVPQASAVLQRLLRAGIIVRDGAAVGFPDHLRIAVGDHRSEERRVGKECGARGGAWHEESK